MRPKTQKLTYFKILVIGRGGGGLPWVLNNGLLNSIRIAVMFKNNNRLSIFMISNRWCSPHPWPLTNTSRMCLEHTYGSRTHAVQEIIKQYSDAAHGKMPGSPTITKVTGLVWKHKTADPWSLDSQL